MTAARTDVLAPPGSTRGNAERENGPRSGRNGISGNPSPSIALLGLFGCGNYGNDGSLEAMLGFLRSELPQAEISCICRETDIVGSTFGINTVPFRRKGPSGGIHGMLNRLFLKIPGRIADFAHAIGHLRETDLIVVPGTGFLDDFGERPTGVPYDIMKWCLAARLTATRVAFVSIGAGPIRNRLSRFFMVSAARLAHHRSYRDLQSRDFMESVGFDTRADAVYPDLAFALPVPAPIRRTPTEPLRVGVGVMAYRGWYGYADGGDRVFSDYIGKMTEFVVRLLDSGHSIRLLTGDSEDLVAVDALQAAVGNVRPGAFLAHGQVGSLDDVMAQMANTDVVVATRFHNIVCALKMGLPTISLGYARKNDVLMAEMGLGKFCQHVETFDVETLLGQFALLVNDTGTYEAGINERVARYRQQLDRQNAGLLLGVTRNR